jgi:Ser/Thr protein kinase RdoA (MazF antagonist)
MAPDDRFEVMRGGTANRGRIQRRGDEVWRPRLPGASARHALLRHLEAAGFDGAPRVRRLGDDVEVLSYIPGSVPDPLVDPGNGLAPWAVGDDALASVGQLLRRLHDATASFDRDVWTWPRRVPLQHRTGAGVVVTHNDPHPGNVVFRDGRAVGLIDFDLAEPGTRAWDLASAACFWVPMLDPADVDDPRAGRFVERFAVLCDGYGADAALREDVREAALDAHDWIYRVIREGAEAGHPGFVRSWRTRRDTAERGRAWIRRTWAA